MPVLKIQILLFQVLKRMGLSLGLERGQVSQEDLSKARSMLPRALEQYLNDLAKNGLGSCSELPRVSSPKIMKEEPSEIDESRYDSDESDVDVNWNVVVDAVVVVVVFFVQRLATRDSWANNRFP